MKILGFDLETTGLDVEKARVIEVGAVLWDVERKTPLALIDRLICHPDEEKVVVSEKIQEITGILPQDLKSCGVLPSQAFKEISELMALCDYVVAHNGNDYDRKIYDAEISRLGWTEKAKEWERPWIDSLTDVPYRAEVGNRRLDTLAKVHGLVNAFPHRAVSDVITMLQLVSQYDFSEIIEVSETPLLSIVAEVAFDRKDLARERGYYWEPKTKRWLKSIREKMLEVERKNSPFRISQI